MTIRANDFQVFQSCHNPIAGLTNWDQVVDLAEVSSDFSVIFEKIKTTSSAGKTPSCTQNMVSLCVADVPVSLAT